MPPKGSTYKKAADGTHLGESPKKKAKVDDSPKKVAQENPPSAEKADEKDKDKKEKKEKDKDKEKKEKDGEKKEKKEKKEKDGEKKEKDGEKKEKSEKKEKDGEKKEKKEKDGEKKDKDKKDKDKKDKKDKKEEKDKTDKKPEVKTEEVKKEATAGKEDDDEEAANFWAEFAADAGVDEDTETQAKQEMKVDTKEEVKVELKQELKEEWKEEMKEEVKTEAPDDREVFSPTDDPMATMEDPMAAILADIAEPPVEPVAEDSDDEWGGWSASGPKAPAPEPAVKEEAKQESKDNDAWANWGGSSSSQTKHKEQKSNDGAQWGSLWEQSSDNKSWEESSWKQTEWKQDSWKSNNDWNSSQARPNEDGAAKNSQGTAASRLIAQLLEKKAMERESKGQGKGEAVTASNEESKGKGKGRGRMPPSTLKVVYSGKTQTPSNNLYIMNVPFHANTESELLKLFADLKLKVGKHRILQPKGEMGAVNCAAMVMVDTQANAEWAISQLNNKEMEFPSEEELQVAAEFGANQYVGTLKAIKEGPYGQMGFIACDKIKEVHGKDVFVNSAQITMHSIEVGDEVVFEMMLKNGKPQAQNLRPKKAAQAAMKAGGQVTAGQNSDGLQRRAGRPPCQEYVRSGTCPFGPKCFFDHPDRPKDAAPEDDGPPIDKTKPPQTLQDWADRQADMFPGMPELKDNWIRIHSQRLNPGSCYYVRVTDMQMTWNLQDCKA